MSDLDPRQEAQRLAEIAERERQTAINDGVELETDETIPPATDEAGNTVAPVETEITDNPEASA